MAACVMCTKDVFHGFMLRMSHDELVSHTSS